MTRSIWKENYESFVNIREKAIAYVSFVEGGGKSCDYIDSLIDKVIDEVMILKSSRDKVYAYCGYDVPQYNDDGVRI